MTIYKIALIFSYIILGIHICLVKCESNLGKIYKTCIKYGVFPFIWTTMELSQYVVILNVCHHYFNWNFVALLLEVGLTY